MLKKDLIMKTLLLMRHAKSSWDDGRLSDHARPLNKRGQHDAPRMGCLLKKANLIPDLIISSDAVRAKATAELVARHCGYPDPVLGLPALYGTDPEKIVMHLQRIPGNPKRLLLIGHNPELEMLIERLAHRYERFPTAAVAHFELSIDAWNQFSFQTPAQLVNLWKPKTMDEDSQDGPGL